MTYDYDAVSFAIIHSSLHPRPAVRSGSNKPKILPNSYHCIVPFSSINLVELSTSGPCISLVRLSSVIFRMSDMVQESDKLTEMINDMKNRGSKEQEIHEIITRLESRDDNSYTSREFLTEF